MEGTIRDFSDKCDGLNRDAADESKAYSVWLCKQQQSKYYRK